MVVSECADASCSSECAKLFIVRGWGGGELSFFYFF